MSTFIPINGMDDAHTLDDVAERVQGILVVDIGSGRALSRRLASLRIAQGQNRFRTAVSAMSALLATFVQI